MSAIVGKHSLQKQLMAGGAVLIGVAAAVAGAVFDFTLKIGSFVLPGWSIYVFAAFAVILGVVLLLSKEDHCAACNVPLESGTAHFPVAHEALVVQALQAGAPDGLAPLPVAPKGSPSVNVDLVWCGNCRTVGRMSCEREQPDGSQRLVEERELGGPVVGALAAVVEKHKAARGEADD